MEMVKRSVRQKKTFPHIVSTTREFGGSHDHEFGNRSVPEVSGGLAKRIDPEIERRTSTPSFPDAQLRIVDGALAPDL